MKTTTLPARFFRSATFVLAASVATSSLASAQTADSMNKPMLFKLSEQNNSGETATATLLQGTDGLIVRVRTNKPEADPQPIHIHKGTCDKLDPKPAYPLHTVTKGVSETTLTNVTEKDLLAGQFAINIHKSTTDIPTYVTCGNLAVNGGKM